ncbi:hypothetical protein [Hymenobacter volaticus]|uniref:Uncharacterized protein n=1 Tax=Hymenobacter volaticus TaxID=2932254 RepID=A0ABY4G7P5_9BACT|nr:hypothetical protein [Hymenobacter volaticus]UOQ66787.1 hypothetical protein MUN86_02375 [Hymenobacter volaticus]
MKQIPTTSVSSPVNLVEGDEKLRAVEVNVNARHQMRFNLVKESVEWRPAGSTAPFQLLDDYRLNSISRELTHLHSPMAPDRLYRLLSSDFTPRVDPLREYFEGLGTAPATNAIAELAATVTVADTSIFELFLIKWLVATVANVLTPTGCQNHTCLVLTGGRANTRPRGWNYYARRL